MGTEAGTTGGEAAGRPCRVVVVGPCASGKSTLVRGLRGLGYDAAVCAQEHSDIPTLWRHRHPDVVIALDVDLETLRRRRGAEWPEAIYRTQLRRLAAARSAAAVVLDSAALSPIAVLAAAAGAIRRVRCTPRGYGGEVADR